MAYRTTDRTREKKDAKRTAMMQAAVKVFSAKGYHAATVRDIVSLADVAIGTFYFYFPDKETLFVFLFEETADFLLQTIQQAVNQHTTLPKQIAAGAQSYVNVAVYEPAIIQLMLVGGVGAVPALAARRAQFRERLTRVWQKPLDAALDAGLIAEQNTRRSAEFLAGGLDEIILNLLAQPNPNAFTGAAVSEITALALGAVQYRPSVSP